jgi:phosphoserine phosphatase
VGKGQVSKQDFLGHPLCVDLDGTLVRTDTLYECLASFIKTRWWLAPLILFWLVRGKGYLKRRLAHYGEFDVKTLPYNEDFLAYLTRQKRRGRRLLLVTAADQSIADAIAAHLGLFDEVLGSNETRNLRGSKKVEAILLVLQGKPFSYAGNDRTDLEIWRHAESALLVNAPKSVVTQSARLTSIEEEFNNPRNIARAFVKALRLHQWLKNVLVFVPIVTANALFDMGAWIGSMVVFVGFCLTASSIYMINALFDLSADRQHRRKRFRPFASGALPLLFGFIVPPLLLTAGLAMGALSGTLPILLTYGLCSIAYSLRLKALPLVDIFTLAALYTMRLFAGGEASGYPVSLWLLGFSCFLFLALAIVKRVAELSAAPASQGKIAGRGYFPSDLEILRMMGLLPASPRA